MEVLISIFVLAGGLLAVAALIPLGRLSLMETEKSDRTGACGRAAMREVRIRGMLSCITAWQYSYNYVSDAIVTPRIPNGHLYKCTVAGTSSATVEPIWPTNGTIVNEGVGRPTWLDIGTAIAIDPLGRYAGLPDTLGVNVTRSNLPITAAQAEAIFRWHDDLTFVRPEDITTGVIPPAGTRPAAVDFDANNIPDEEGSYSWFLTLGATLQPGTFTASVVVCQKRVLTAAGGVPDGEEASPGPVTCDTATGYGGIGITINNAKWPTKWSLTKNDWILLYSATQTATWYRVAHAGYDEINDRTHISLVGPDWHGGTAATAVSIEGVTGVYTSTVQLN